MTFWLRAILRLVAIILFLIAALSDENYADLLAFGLMCLAGGLLVEELGLGRMRFGPQGRGDAR